MFRCCAYSAVLLFAVSLTGVGNESADCDVKPTEIRWRTFADGRQAARKLGLPMLIFVGGGGENWDCYWSLHYEQSTFRDKRIVQLASEKMVPVFVKFYLEDSNRAALGVKAVPTVVVTSPDGKILGRKEGFTPPVALQKWIYEILSTSGVPR